MGGVSRRRNLGAKEKRKEVPGRCQGPDNQTWRKQDRRTYRIQEG